LQCETLQQRLSRVQSETGYLGALGRGIGRVLFGTSECLDRVASALVCGLPPRLLTSSVDRERLSCNSQLAGRHSGGRCFILGNGPSLRNEEIELLNGQTCFTVNQGHRFAQSVGLQPRYHAVVDPTHIGEENDHLFSEWAAFSDHPGPTLLLTTRLADHFEALGHRVNHYAVKQYLISTYFDRSDRMVPIDLRYVQPGYVSVIHFCIVAALYMKFSEICLLGCDMDFFIEPEAPFEHSYSYDTGRQAKSAAELFGWDQVDLMAWALIEYRAFRQLGRLAERLGSRIINCSRSSALNVYPRKPLREFATNGRS
jgi:hypothetical protein